MIEVTASSRTQSPDPFAFHGPTPHTPDLATPALSTGSLSVPQSPALAPPALQPWYFPHDYDVSSMDSSLALEHDPFALSRRSSTSSHASRTVPNAMRSGAMPPPDEKDSFLRQDQWNRPPVMPSNYLSVDSINNQSPTPHDPDQLPTLSPSVPSLQIPQGVYGGMDMSTASPVSDSMMTGVPSAPTPAEKHSYAFTEHYAHLFSSAYFHHVHPLYPFLDHDTYYRHLAAVYNSSNNQPPGFSFTAAGFEVYMVQAIGARILEYQGGVQQSFREAYFSAAMLCSNQSNKLETLHDIHSGLLLLVFSRFIDAAEIEPLTLKATVTSSCVQLGLHKPKPSTTPFSEQDICALRTFISAYMLDRTISLSLNAPFSMSDDDLEIETLVFQLEQHQQQQQHHQHHQHTLMPSSPSPSPSPAIPPITLAVLTTTAKLYRITSTVHSVHSHSRPNSQGIPRLSTPFLTTPTPTTLSTWRSEIFRTLETLTAEFQQRKAAQTQPQFQGPQLDDVYDTVELLINAGILFLLHPPSSSSSAGTTSPNLNLNLNLDLNPFEIRTVQSTARTTVSMCRRLQGSKTLIPSLHLARVVYLSGVALWNCLNTQNNNGGGGGSSRAASKKSGGSRSGKQGRKGSNTGVTTTPPGSGGSGGGMSGDPDIALCRDILRWFSDEGVGIAGAFAEKLEDR